MPPLCLIRCIMRRMEIGVTNAGHWLLNPPPYRDPLAAAQGRRYDAPRDALPPRQSVRYAYFNASPGPDFCFTRALDFVEYLMMILVRGSDSARAR